MVFFDWLFGGRASDEGDERLRAAVERVIEGTDPRIRALGNVRERLSPAVAHALDYTRRFVGLLPPVIDMTQDKWTHSPILRAVFARPADVANALSNSVDLREFLASPQAVGMDRVHCVVSATRVERTVFGTAMEGDLLRQDIAQKTVGFTDFRLVGFSASEALLRERIEEIVLEGLVLAALRNLADNKQRSDQLEAYRQLLLTRLRLMEQSGAGMDSLIDSLSREGRDIGRMRRELAKNEAELSALKFAGFGFDAVIGQVIEALHNAESVIRPVLISLRLNSMNIVVGPEVADASTVELIEFSTASPHRPRRVAFLVSFPRDSVVERRVDFDAMLQAL